MSCHGGGSSVGFGDFVWTGVSHIGAVPSEWTAPDGGVKLPDGIDHILFVLALLLATHAAVPADAPKCKAAVLDLDKEKGADGGVTCFLVDREAGWTSASIPTMGEWGPASLSFQDVRVPHSAILGEEGRGFALAMKWIGKKNTCVSPTM